jgi:hypothetical protein
MDTIAALGRTLGFSFAAGLNLYATVAILGLAERYGWVDLPPQYQVFNNPYIISIALVMYVIEFFADKIPWVDTIWDGIHTIVRPLGGALIAVATLGHASATTTRAVANTSPEPFSNWILSVGEDAFVVGLGVVALKYPVIAFGVTLVLLIAIVLFARMLIRFLRRRFGRAQPA